MQDMIGNAAGQIWRLLSNTKEQINIADIPKKTNLPAQTAYQGLGWLAREGKVQYEKRGRSIYVNLCEAEAYVK